jgi:predicted metal-dependent peptidase
VEFDTEIKMVEKNFNRARSTFKVMGRGGTDYSHIVDMADKEKVDGLIIYTDGMADAPRKPKCKVLWLMSQKNYNPPVDWGFRVHLNRFEDNKV